MREATRSTYGTRARPQRGRRNGQWALAEVSSLPGCKAYFEDVSSLILTLGFGSMRNDECEEGRHRFIGSGEHSQHLHRSTAERRRHVTDSGVTPFRQMNGALTKRCDEDKPHFTDE